MLRDLVTRAVSKGISLDGKFWVDTSTVHPQTCTECSARLAEKGATFIASPVFGASPVAASGKLIFAMAGSEAVIDRLRPFIVDVMGRRIIYMGEEVHKSSLLKISGYEVAFWAERSTKEAKANSRRNIFVIGFQELIAEGLVFAEKTGLGTRQMEDFIGDMFGPVVQSYSKRMTTGAYAPPLDTQPGFAVSLAIKDVRHAISIGDQHGTKIPTLEKALSRMIAAREYAGESLDSSSLYGVARTDADLGFWSENSRQGNETSK